MAKYALLTEKDNLHEAIGVTEDRIDELIEKCRNVCIRAVLTDQEMDNIVKATEALLNETQPQNIVEAVVIGKLFGRMYERTIQEAKRMEHILSKITKGGD